MKQRILITIDTEGHIGANPVDKLIWGHTVDGTLGIERFMDEFEKINAQILFFLDFAEAWHYGEEKIREVAQCILSRGHNLGVHIHPDHMADKKRKFLWEYTYKEQEEIIGRCTELYEKIVGKKPLSFRAGKYGANMDTIEILSKYGYKYDFSEYYGQKWCGIKPAITINAPVKCKDIIEFPVTVHRMIKVFNYSRYDKIDVESMVPSELRHALSQVINQKFEVVIILFLHSFSLMEWVENPDYPRKSNEKIRKLLKAIETIKENKELELINEEKLNKIVPVEQIVAMQSEILWKLQIKVFWFAYHKLKYIARRNRKALLLLGCIRGVIYILIGIVLVLQII